MVSSQKLLIACTLSSKRFFVHAQSQLSPFLVVLFSGSATRYHQSPISHPGCHAVKLVVPHTPHDFDFLLTRSRNKSHGIFSTKSLPGSFLSSLVSHCSIQYPFASFHAYAKHLHNLLMMQQVASRAALGRSCFRSNVVRSREWVHSSFY